jgi:hypothetical protein
MMAVQVLDAEGHCSPPKPQLVDALPMDLIDRAFGRLRKAAANDHELGLAAAYVGVLGEWAEPRKQGVWTAEHRAAGSNARTSEELMRSIGDYFEAHPTWWFDTPRFDPKSSG